MEVLNEMMYDFDNGVYLASEEFIKFLNNVKQKDICEYLPEDIKNIT